MELESVYSSEIPIAKTTASGIDRVIGRDIEKGILIYVAHHWSFALPVISRVLNNAKRIDPEPSDYFQLALNTTRMGMEIYSLLNQFATSIASLKVGGNKERSMP